MSDFAALVDRAGQLCRAVAGRDLVGQELYIIRQSAISGEYGTADSCEAYTAPCLDLYLREFIGPNWQGRGPCLVLNDLAMADVHPEDRDAVVLTSTLHELAHILDRPVLYRTREQPDPDRLKFEALVLADEVGQPTPTTGGPLWSGHGASFIRTPFICATGPGNTASSCWPTTSVLARVTDSPEQAATAPPWLTNQPDWPI